MSRRAKRTRPDRVASNLDWAEDLYKRAVHTTDCETAALLHETATLYLGRAEEAGRLQDPRLDSLTDLRLRSRHAVIRCKR